MAAHTNQVAEVKQFKELKPSLAHQTHRQDSSGKANVALLSLQICGGGFAKLGRKVGNGVGPTKFVWIRSQAQRLNLLQFFLTLLKLLARLKFQRENPFQYRRGV